MNSGDSVSDAGNPGASIFCGAMSSTMPLSWDKSAGNATGVTVGKNSAYLLFSNTSLCYNDLEGKDLMDEQLEKREPRDLYNQIEITYYADN